MRLPSYYVASRAEAIESACILLPSAVTEGERDLLASVWCDHQRGIGIAESAGITARHFTQDDFAMLFQACAVCRDREPATLHRVAVLMLKAGGYWNPTGAIRCGPDWSFESLMYLRGLYFHSPQQIERNARRLLDLSARLRRADELLDELMGTLNVEELPARRTEPAKQRMHVLPLKTRGAA